MAAAAIAKTVFEERTRKLQGLMAEKEIDGFMIVTGPDYIYFTGDYRRQPRAFIPQKGDPTLFVFEAEAEEAAEYSWIEDIRTFRDLPAMMKSVHDHLALLGIQEGTIALEFRFHTPAFLVDRFKAVNKGIKLTDSTAITAPLRMYKSDEEVSIMQEAAHIAEKAMLSAMGALAEGVREDEAAAQAEFVARKAGAPAMAVPTFVNSGHRSLWTHGTATNKTLNRGDLVLIDIMPIYGGYCSDLTRIAVIGPPTREQQRIHDAYVRAEHAVLNAIAPGKTVLELDKVALQVFQEEDLDRHWIHLMTHGIGLDFEETPAPTIVPPDGRIPLGNGMVVSTGHSVLAVPGIGGVRVEDVAHIRDGKAHLLTNYPTEMVVV